MRQTIDGELILKISRTFKFLKDEQLGYVSQSMKGWVGRHVSQSVDVWVVESLSRGIA